MQYVCSTVIPQQMVDATYYIYVEIGIDIRIYIGLSWVL